MEKAISDDPGREAWKVRLTLDSRDSCQCGRTRLTVDGY